MQKKSTHDLSTREGENSGKKITGFEIGFVLGMILFPLFFMVIVPYIHELLHVLCLELYGCDYVMQFYYSVLNGLHAQTIFSTTTCELNSVQTNIVYLAGVGGNLLLSIFLFLLTWLLTKKLPLAMGCFLLPWKRRW